MHPGGELHLRAPHHGVLAGAARHAGELRLEQLDLGGGDADEALLGSAASKLEP